MEGSNSVICSECDINFIASTRMSDDGLLLDLLIKHGIILYRVNCIWCGNYCELDAKKLTYRCKKSYVLRMKKCRRFEFLIYNWHIPQSRMCHCMSMQGFSAGLASSEATPAAIHYEERTSSLCDQSRLVFLRHIY